MTELIREAKADISYLYCAGGGEMPVVLLHGIGSNAQSFEPLLRAFEGRFPALAWDAPGYGDSPPLTAEWPDADDYAMALLRLIDALGFARSVLVGHSLGNLTAARFAVRWPARVAALALISPALGYGAERGAPLPPSVAKRIEDLDRLGPAQFAAARAPGLVGDPVARPEIVRAVERSMAAIRRPGYDQASRMLATGRLSADAAALDVPTTVVVGTKDRVTPPSNARQLYDLLPEPRERHCYREVEGAGHAVCQEQPATVAGVIANMIDDTTMTGRTGTHG
jgi:pimeloyl-ACP methyl ester carboxylesterase